MKPKRVQHSLVRRVVTRSFGYARRDRPAALSASETHHYPCGPVPPLGSSGFGMASKPEKTPAVAATKPSWLWGSVPPPPPLGSSGLGVRFTWTAAELSA